MVQIHGGRMSTAQHPQARLALQQSNRQEKYAWKACGAGLTFLLFLLLQAQLIDPGFQLLVLNKKRATGPTWTDATKCKAPHKPLLLLAVLDL